MNVIKIPLDPPFSKGEDKIPLGPPFSKGEVNTFLPQK